MKWFKNLFFPKKKLPKVEIINFILRSNKIYQVIFQRGVLTIDDKIIWQLEGKMKFLNTPYRLKLEGTGPQNFRRKVKMRLRNGRNSKLVV